MDFSKHSNEELENSLERINQDRYPENYQACLREIEKRKAQGVWQASQRCEGLPFEYEGTREIRHTLTGKNLVLIGLILFLYSSWLWWSGEAHFTMLISKYCLSVVLVGVGFWMIRGVSKKF